ncbi:hypothetical protein CDS [Salmonella enterica subsp. enterica serovar Derby]|nr:hypothetical protein CDS [Salmonella enterica subsp. enterica serovar Derby]
MQILLLFSGSFEICIATEWLNTEWLASEKCGIKPSLSLIL